MFPRLRHGLHPVAPPGLGERLAPRWKNRARGFSLIEAAMVTSIVGFGVVGLMQLLAAGSVSNYEGSELTVASSLANNIHEIAAGLEARDPQTPGTWSTKEQTAGHNDVTQYDDVLDLDGETFSPPLDVNRSPITSMSDWSQLITVNSVGLNNLSTTKPNTVTEPTVRITVTVKHRAEVVYQTSWIVSTPQ